MSSLQKIARTRAAFRNWFAASVLCGVSLAMRRSSLVTRLMTMLPSVDVALGTTSGIVIRCPMLDVLPPVEVFAMGEYDHPAIDWDEVESVIDCGAHVGSFSLWATMKSSCKVFAIEPNPDTFALLRRNVSHLADRIVLCPLAVAGTAEGRTLYDAGTSSSASLLHAEDTPGRILVEAATLRTIVHMSGFTSVDLLKIDIEGAEQEVFRTIEDETLKIVRTIMIECHGDLGADTALIERRLTDAGMRVTHASHHAGTLLSFIVAWRDRCS